VHTDTHTHAHKTPSWVSLIFTSRPHASCAATGPKITLRFLRLLVNMCVRTYHVCNNYITYIVAMRPCFSGLRQFRRLLCVAIMSSLAQSEMDTEKQRQHRRDGTRLTESRNTRSEQLLVVPTELLTKRKWLPGELLNGLECREPGWFLDMKYQTCCARLRTSTLIQVSGSAPKDLAPSCASD